MENKSLLEQAREQRNRVLWAELGGWLHDLGKLSSAFVWSKADPAYNTGGEGEGEGGPSEAEEKEEKWRHPQILESDGRQVMFAIAPQKEWPPIADLVANHHKGWKKLSPIEKLLKRADQDDSGEDEYNAVGLHQREPVQAATVFGREEALADDLTSWDNARLALYDGLAPLLQDPAANRQAIWDLLQEAMRRGLGKTQRAANDIRLDQHAWGVATRFKAFLLRDLLDPPPEEQKWPRRTFRLLTVHWDWWETVTPFARLSDVVGRVVMLDDLREALRRLIEGEYAIGNRIYEDDDGVHFMIADLEWGEELEARIRSMVNEGTGGEALPVIRLGPSTERVIDLVGLMEEARQELPPVGEPAWAAAWQETPSNVVCPVCRRRPLEGDRDLCPWCEQRRREGIARRLVQKGTVWNGEIADGTGRVALLVARFDLEGWLDGTMLHTLFITAPSDLAAAPKLLVPVSDWQALREAGAELYTALPAPPYEEENVRCWGRERADTPEGTLARHITAQFGRLGYVTTLAQDLQNRYDLDPADAFLLALVRKNPSASRLLRVWQTTETFLHQQAEGLSERVGERRRVVFTLEGAPRPGLYTARVPGLGQVDLFIRPDDHRAQTVARLSPAAVEDLVRRSRGRTVRLLIGEGGRRVDRDCRIADVAAEPYRPIQVITTSPDLMLVMLPAGVALEAAERLQEAYADEFGKVQGRLPFHVGLFFMDAHYPMFAALDAARRLVETFNTLGKEWDEAEVVGQEEDGGVYTFTLHSDRFGCWPWRIPARRGDDETDWYHPYLPVRQGEALEERTMSLLGPYGRWVHVSQVQVGDRVAFRPNLFDWLFLDTVSRRLEAHADPRTRRRRHPLFGPQESPRPYLLERAGDLRRVWKRICAVEGMSETRLQAVTTLLARKRKEWMANPAARESYEWLVRETTARDLGGDRALREAILDGTFFDTVELHRHILKRDVERPSKEEAR